MGLDGSCLGSGLSTALVAIGAGAGVRVVADDS
jgi:hypothetical protein